MADHGFTELRTEVCLNTWLKQQGLLSLTGTPDDEWDASKISPDSKAFVLDPGRIYIHRKNKFARGNVRTEDVPRLLTTIKNGLLALKWKNEPVMKAVHTREELYPGANSDQVPDLVCQAPPRFRSQGKI